LEQEQQAASHLEVQDLKEQIQALSVKMDLVSSSVNLVHNMLSEQKGANLPNRLKDLEDKILVIKELQDQRAELPNAVKQTQTDIRLLFRFQYMMAGALIIIQILTALAGGFILNYMFGSSP
jgi:archaellum component FlaC